MRIKSGKWSCAALRAGPTAQPFEWKFTRQDLDELLVKVSTLR